MPKPNVAISELRISSKKLECTLPKMDKLIELGLIKKGDTIYLTIKPNESIATLIDEKYVNYNGKKMTLNEWGCKVTGWKSIRIYAYITILGETETLHQKRLKFISNYNETIK